MEYLPQLLEYAESIKDKPMSSLLITAEMESEYIPDELGNIHFDGLLSKAVVYKIPCNFQEKYQYFIPLPLLLLGQQRQYYCCSVALPGDYVKGRFYWRKRSELRVPQKIRMGAGAYKAYNVRHDTIHTNTLKFLAHGIKKEIEDLLGYISNVGKKRNYGKGEIRKWTVEPIDNPPEDCIIHDSQVLRPIPVTEIESTSPPITAAYYPPYWHYMNETECYVPI
ncbi:MAG: hypothetical protein AMQ22_01456 [Candidatus Methanofastidiosum methylothiophilum]|jgi:hypothetical protein|uniref:RAMP superfamily protein n=1 Tax=Candidatus Methanofastidiosum methylothiophilum TaxID=1705564 RepID=A0A150J0L5_9EURY|nr:MAG: hypothetical protein AMQ22_01456 [Candidatus Methanofastidiosum methylthiophilus]OPY25006.1 MAG: hypothetical protein A4E26_00043 [Methanobacterium sp. PtaU1.Bin097]